jgi:hypothetical protein
LHIVYSAPFVFQDIQADPSGEVDVWMVDRGLEEDRRRRIRVVDWESEAELEIQA